MWRAARFPPRTDHWLQRRDIIKQTNSMDPSWRTRLHGNGVSFSGSTVPVHQLRRCTKACTGAAEAADRSYDLVAWDVPQLRHHASHNPQCVNANHHYPVWKFGMNRRGSMTVLRNLSQRMGRSLAARGVDSKSFGQKSHFRCVISGLGAVRVPRCPFPRNRARR